MIKKIMLSCVLALGITSSAGALCYTVSPGLFVVNHRTGVLRGGNFRASIRCSRNAPQLMLWRGGTLCDGSFFYGRYLGKPFSCNVYRISR